MTILVGVDDSGPSRAALVWALKRAREDGTEVCLVHVVDDEWGQAGPQVAAAESADGARMLADAMRYARETVPSTTLTEHLVHGSPAWTLAELAAPDDLIVVGTHKTGYLHGRVLGSRSIVVASVAPCTVAVVPDTPMSGRHGVIVGVGPGVAWRAAVTTGALEAQTLGQELSLITALPGYTDEAAVEGRAVLAAASALAIETAPNIEVRSRLSRRQPVEALLDASRSASLLVLGASRRSPERAGFVGSVTHDVLLNINAPVLVARPIEAAAPVTH